MSPFSNKYFIGSIAEDKVSMVVGDPKVFLKPPTFRDHLKSILQFLSPAQGWVSVALPRVINPIDVNVDINDPQFDPMDSMAIYNSEREANNALIKMRSDINWDLHKHRLSLDNFEIFDNLQIYRTDDMLPDLIKNTQLRQPS